MKKKRTLATLALVIPVVLGAMTLISWTTQKTTTTIKLDTRYLDQVSTVEVVGSQKPLSWSRGLQMTDPNGDGIYEVSASFKASKSLKFKFVIDGVEELAGSDARVVWVSEEPIIKEYVYNEYHHYTAEEIDKITYTDEQIDEDVAVLRDALEYIHPFLDTYTTEDERELAYQELAAEIKTDPSISTAYGAVSQFAAKIKCSHTFTNPWNQGYTVEKSLFYQPDKMPLTFSRVGKRLLVDKNASDNDQLTKGLEITAINGVSTSEILTNLATYITSDGSNYEKKLERLSLDGDEKFSLFDIFYPIAYGSVDTYQLELKDLKSGETSTITVPAMSKTHRTKILMDRYGDLATSFEDSWDFDIKNEVGLLTLGSFAVQGKDFNWKKYLDQVFDQLNEQKTPNLIVDIRGNEGGQSTIAEYIIERVLQQPLTIESMESTVNYKTIPDRLKKHMSTWDKLPYDWTKAIGEQVGDQYRLKPKYSVKGDTYKPKKNGYKGKVYLITDASNSSATHLMASYAKQVPNITIIGQETGGNRLGTNGGYMFFLRLPNSKVEIDIPVIHYFVPMGDEPVDGGIQPDIYVEPSVEDIASGIDSEIDTIFKLINSK